MTGLRVALFVAIAASILFGLHYYLWARLVRDTHLPPPWSNVVTAGLVILAASLVTGMVASRVLPRSASAPIVWTAFTWMGLAFFLVVLVAFADLSHLFVSLARRVGGDRLVDPARRETVARWIAGAAALVAVSLSGVSLESALGAVAIRRVKVALPRLPRNRAGYVIAQLTDIHVGSTIGRAFIEDLVTRTNALQPDLIAITGDLVDGSVETLAVHVAPLARLRAKDGVYFVTGNHEYYSGVDAWIAHLTTLGIKVLRNERVAVGGEGEAAFDLAGIDDWTAHQFGAGHGADLPGALRGRDPSRALVLLAHQPKAIIEAAALGVGLQLSGHTHGGQLFPFNYLVKLQQPYVAGLHAHGDAQIYVSRGTGYWGPPMRLGAPAEITRIELVSADA